MKGYFNINRADFDQSLEDYFLKSLEIKLIYYRVEPTRMAGSDVSDTYS
jgi:hypothetical protein